MSSEPSATNTTSSTTTTTSTINPTPALAHHHNELIEAVHAMWNCHYKEAEALLNPHKGTNPRYALEYANLIMLQVSMSATNEQREAMLEHYLVADKVAKEVRYGEKMHDGEWDSDNEVMNNDEEDMWVVVAEQDVAHLSIEDKKRLEEYQQRKKEKAEKNQQSTTLASSSSAAAAAQPQKHVAPVVPTPPKKTRAQEKADFLAAKAEAVKTGTMMDQSWKLECDVIEADALLVRSLVQFAMDAYIRGGYNFRVTWGMYRALLKEMESSNRAAVAAGSGTTTGGGAATTTGGGPPVKNISNSTIPKELEMNIKYGAGVFYCYLALVPAGLMTLLSAIGFVSDKELGEALLTEVFMSNTIRSPMCALVLLTYYLFLPTGLGNVEDTLAKAKVILDKMNEQYPDNAYFFAYSSHYHRKRGETAEAVASIQRAIDNAQKGTKAVTPVLLLSLLGDTLYMDLQFDKAKDAYLSLLDTVKSSNQKFAYTGQVMITVAGCYMVLGEESKAKEIISRVSAEHNSKSKHDLHSPKIAAKCIAEPKFLPLLTFYILYVNRDLAHMKGEKVDFLLALLEKQTAKMDVPHSPPEVKAFYHLMKAVTNKSCGRKEVATVELNEILVNLKPLLAKDSVVTPYAYYEAGELEYRAGNLDNAKKLFDKGQKYPGDGHETLVNRYGIAQKQLKAAMAAANASK